MVNNEDQLDYIDQVHDRARKLVQTQVWNGIKEQRLDNWLGCLKNHDAELLSAYLLDNLCFRSHEQFNSMLDTLFLNIYCTLTDTTHDECLVERLRKKPKTLSDNGIRLTPVMSHSSPPTKSGPYILRLAQRRFGIHNDWLIWPDQIDTVDSLTELIFVDDFCGSGKQFTDFCDGINLRKLVSLNPKLHVTYLVATAHINGIKKIKDDLPFVNVKFAERLGEATSVLSGACFARYQIEGFEQQVIEQYQQVIQKSGLPTSGKLANGYGDLGLAYAFSHATPNNTLPIFWFDTDHFTPLLDR